MLTGESKISRIRGRIETEGCIMEIWALSSDKKHFWHGNCILLLPPGRLLSILGDVCLLLVAVKSSNAEEKPAGWHRAPAEREAKA